MRYGQNKGRLPHHVINAMGSKKKITCNILQPYAICECIQLGVNQGYIVVCRHAIGKLDEEHPTCSAHGSCSCDIICYPR